MKRKKSLPIYYKLIVDGKLVDVFPVQSGCTRSHFPPHYRRLLTLKGVSLTFGNDAKVNAAARQWGAVPQDTSATDIIIDPKNKVVTTPCYMLKARISQLAEGIEKLVQALIQMT